LPALLGASLLAILFATTSSTGQPIVTASFEPVGGEVRAPSGWKQFCRDWPVECPDANLEPRDIVLTPTAWDAVLDANRTVNETLKPITDKEHFGRSEYWTYPQGGKGDCEDYLLLKRRLLMNEGYPQQALLITVVALPNGDGHAVLTVRTDRGEFVLDNLRDEVLPWNETGYRFVKRQSQHNPNIWVTLGNESQQAVAAAK
jgi:predicted transglutaminase-like cysteine proteinase